MFTKAKILLFFIFLTCFINVNAQTNFIKGYYVNNAQDTIHGYVDYRSEKRNYNILVFKKELNSKPIRLNPEDIIGFTVDNKDFYEKQNFKNRKGEALYGFFRIIIRGKLSLLRYHSRYFAKNLEGEVFEISKRTELSDGKIREDYYGLGMLKVLMKDCNGISSDFLEKEYKSTSNFIRIFRIYNSCVNSALLEPSKVTIKPHLDLGVIVSPTITKLSLGSSLKDASFDKELSLGFGVFASLFLPKVDENIRLVLEANYSKYSQYAYFSSGNTNNDLFVDYSSVKIPVFIRYSFNRFFFDAGIQTQFITNQNFRWRIETIQQSNIYTDEGEVTPLNNRTTGYLVGVGLKQSILNHPVRASIRFSHVQALNHPNKPMFRTVELSISFQLN